MRAALETCRQWEAEGKRVAAATVVAVAGSTPRREGARLLVSSAGDTWGSVSNGCVEGDVAAHAAEVLRTGRPHLAAYGITDEFAFDVGLSCGGSIEVFIEPWAGLAERLAGGLGEGFVGAVATVMDGPGQGAHGLFDRERGWVAGDLPASLAELLAPAAAAAVDAEHSHILPVGESRVFVQAVTPAPRLLLFGAGHTAEALAPMAAAAGFPEAEPSPDLFARLYGIPEARREKKRLLRPAFEWLARPGLQPVYAALTALLMVVSFVAFHPEGRGIRKQINLRLHQGIGSVEKLYADAGSVKGDIKAFSANVVKSFNTLGLLKGDENKQ